MLVPLGCGSLEHNEEDPSELHPSLECALRGAPDV